MYENFGIGLVASLAYPYNIKSTCLLVHRTKSVGKWSVPFIILLF